MSKPLQPAKSSISIHVHDGKRGFGLSQQHTFSSLQIQPLNQSSQIISNVDDNDNFDIVIENSFQKKFGFWNDLSQRWDSITSKEKFKKIKQGIDALYRPIIWRNILDPHHQEEFSKRPSVQKLIEIGEMPSWKTIAADVPRTLVHIAEIHTPEGQEKLGVLLRAYSNLDSELSYFQGMSSTAGIILLNFKMNVEPSLWSFCAIMKNKPYCIRNFFLHSFKEVDEFSKIWDWFFNNHYPKISFHLEQLTILSLMYTRAWFLTLFSSIPFSEEILSLIFDRFITYGRPALISFGLVIISRHKKEILAGDLGQVMNYLQRPDKYHKMDDISKLTKKFNLLWVDQEHYDQVIKQLGLTLDC